MPGTFRITEHTLEAAHIREYPRATSTNQDEVLQLAITQYTPLSNPDPKSGDVTVIAAHANGFPKELYEPLWEELVKAGKEHGFGIRGFWIADIANQGQSSVLNEDKLGDDPSWLDHSRDLLHIVNTFRSQMPRPLIGIGHSMGGCQLANLALLHPRLLETLILIDPVMQGNADIKIGAMPALASSMRRDRWPSREAAAKSMLRSKFYQSWDKRVFDQWIAYGLRDLPTALYPESTATPGPVPATVTADPATTPAPPQPKEVTLTTTKHQEVLTFLRPNWAFRPGVDSEPSSAEYSMSNLDALNRRTHPDITPVSYPQTPFYRPEMVGVFTQLPRVRPSVFYIFGSTSSITMNPNDIPSKVQATGSGVGGSGGVKEGRVDHVVVQDAGHLIPMEKVEESAQHIATWVGKEMIRYRDNESKIEQDWGTRKGVERRVPSARYIEELKGIAAGGASKPQRTKSRL